MYCSSSTWHVIQDHVVSIYNITYYIINSAPPPRTGSFAPLYRPITCSLCFHKDVPAIIILSCHLSVIKNSFELANSCVGCHGDCFNKLIYPVDPAGSHSPAVVSGSGPVQLTSSSTDTADFPTHSRNTTSQLSLLLPGHVHSSRTTWLPPRSPLARPGHVAPAARSHWTACRLASINYMQLGWGNYRRNISLPPPPPV